MVRTMLEHIVWLCWVLLVAVMATTFRVKQGNTTKDNFIEIKFSDDKILELYNCLCQWRHCVVNLRTSRREVVTVTNVVGQSIYCGVYLGFFICRHNNPTDQLLCDMKSSNIFAGVNRSCLSYSRGVCACVGLEWVFSGEMILKTPASGKNCDDSCSVRDPSATVSTEHLSEDNSGRTSCNLTSASSEPDSKINHATLVVAVTVSLLGTAAISILGVVLYRRRRRGASKEVTSEIYSGLAKRKRQLLTNNQSLISSATESPSPEEMKYFPKCKIKKYQENSTAVTNSYEPVEDFLNKQSTRAKRKYEVIETDIQTSTPSCGYTENDVTSRPLKEVDKVWSSAEDLETGYEYIEDREDLQEPRHRTDGSYLNSHRTARSGETDDPYYESVSIKSDVCPAAATVVEVERVYTHGPLKEHPAEQLGLLGEVNEPSYSSSQYSKLRDVRVDNLNLYDHLNQA